MNNKLLTSLSASDYKRIQPHLMPVTMPLGWVISESCIEPKHVIFPTTSIVTLLCALQDGTSTEFAVVGNDGVVGFCMFMGGQSTPSQAVVQSAGHGYQLDASVLKTEFSHAGGLQKILLRYTQALLTQMTQTAACNRYHSLDQQLCRWLLMSLDRLPSNDLTMTQELIASILGVRREGITAAAGRLQAEGLIRYGRGKITVLDRPKLEARVCECYEVVKRESDRLLPSVPIAQSSPK